MNYGLEKVTTSFRVGVDHIRCDNVMCVLTSAGEDDRMFKDCLVSPKSSIYSSAIMQDGTQWTDELIHY